MNHGVQRTARKLRTWLLLSAGIVGAGVLAAEPAAPRHGGGSPHHHRVQPWFPLRQPPNPGPPAAPLKKVAYLGVSVERADAAIRSQFGLAEGTGLVIRFVDPKGPSADTLRLFDVMTRLDDQILVNPEQLAALVRMHKPGDKVTLEVIRGGQHRKVEVVLGEKELPPLESLFMSPPMMPIPVPLPGLPGANTPGPTPFPGGPPLPPEPLKPGAGPQNPPPPPAPNMPSPLGGKGPQAAGGFGMQAPTPGGVTAAGITQGALSVVLTVDPVNGRRVVCTKAGQVRFNGPVNTPEEMNQVPEEFRPLLDRLLPRAGGRPAPQPPQPQAQPPPQAY